MQFLKYLFWCLLAFLAAVFTFGNWTTVDIQLWGGLIAQVNLPFLLLATFLAGLLPMLIYHRTHDWRLRQRLQTTERTVEALRVSLAAEPSPPPSLPTAPAPAPAAPPLLPAQP